MSLLRVNNHVRLSVIKVQVAGNPLPVITRFGYMYALRILNCHVTPPRH